MQDGLENFKLTDEGNVDKFLGIEITKIDSSSFKLSQTFLIVCSLQFLDLCNNSFETMPTFVDSCHERFTSS